MTRVASYWRPLIGAVGADSEQPTMLGVMATIGRRTWKIVPIPIRLVTVSLPPIISTSALVSQSNSSIFALP
jgi:hypothetical protein